MTQSKPPIYDSHAHLIGEDTVKYPRNVVVWDISMLPKGGPYGPGTIGLPGGYHGETPLNIKPSAEAMREWMIEENVVGITAVQKGLIYRTDNRYILDAAASFPDVMSAVIIIDPEEEGTLDVIRNAASRGAVGIRFFPIGENIDEKIKWMESDEAVACWELANELGIVVDIEAPAVKQTAMVPFILRMSERFKDLRIVLDHVFLPDLNAEGFGLNEYYQDLAARHNIYVKWTSLNMDVVLFKEKDPVDVFNAVFALFGADKIMWGSDIGTSSGSYKQMVERAYESMRDISEQDQQKIMHDTGRRVFVGD
jgi:predicted TIM-barrel fold metal-dependent hydrolase